MEEEYNNQEQLTKKERRQLRRQGKEEEHQKQAQKVKMKRGLKYVVIIVIILGIGVAIWAMSRSQAPMGEDLSIAVPSQGRNHVQPQATHPEYSSNPPTSGWHSPSTVKVGFYEEEIPDEQIIHNLEHGDIWISYRPDIDQVIKEELKKFKGSKVIITPRSANDTDIALVAWTRLDKFDIENDTLNKSRIDNFIKRYINRGPEKIR